jgi:hypothetical protein
MERRNHALSQGAVAKFLMAEIGVIWFPPSLCVRVIFHLPPTSGGDEMAL